MGFNIGNIILGGLGVALGILIMKEAFYINHHLFFLDFVEKKFGGGTGTLAYRIVGLVLCFFSIAVMIGLIDPNQRNVSGGGDSTVKIQNNGAKIPGSGGNNGGFNIAP